MITTILAALLLVGNSLTVSPVGLTYHFEDAYEGYDEFKFSPNALDKSQQITWHPELNLIYKTKYMQYNLFYMRDSFFKHSMGGLLGPKYDIFEYASIGIVGGLIAKQRPPTRCANEPGGEVCVTVGDPQVKKISTEDFHIIPIAALTFSIKIPISKNISIETNSAVTPVFIHNVLGVRFDF